MNNEQRCQVYGVSAKDRYQKELKLLESWQISQRNKEMILKFHDYLFSTKCKEMRVAKLSSQLRRICVVIGKDLDTVEREDIEKCIAHFNKQYLDKSEATFCDYVRCLKQFYKWFEEEDQRLYGRDKDKITRIRTMYKALAKRKAREKVKQADFRTIITDNEIDIVIEKGAKTAKEKAFLKVLHESGMRCSEMLLLQIKDVTLTNNYVQVRVPDGKTGEREIILIQSVPHLLRYLDVHPFKDNPTSPLWVGESMRHRYRPIGRNGIQKMMNKCFTIAGIKKQHNLHWFRHSRATLLAPHLTEILLCKFMGWVIGSSQPQRYCHLSQQQVHNAIMNMHGIEFDEKKQENVIVKCKCDALNDAKARYCYRCHNPMNVSVVLQDKELMNDEMNKTIQFMMEIAKNPEMMKAFEEFRKKKET